MSKIIYVPLEHIDARYTVHLDRDITKFLDESEIEYIKIYPDTPPPRPLPKGMFLDAPYTTNFKCLQLAEIAKLFEYGVIKENDIIFFSDIWFPGIESIAYMEHFTGTKVRIRGILHAGSFTDTDEVRNFERWAKNFEDIVFDIADQVYVASNFIAQDIVKKRFINMDKITVTPLPLDKLELDKYKGSAKKDPIVIFNGRDHIEKQPWLWDELKAEVEAKWYENNPGEDCPFEFYWTQQHNLPKADYYSLMAKSQVVVSFALQENFGYGIAEAAYLGCIPILPNRLVYPEMYNQDMLYGTFTEAVNAVYDALTHYDELINYYPNVCTNNMLDTGNLDSIKTWFADDKR